MRDPVSKLIRWVLGDEQTARSRLMRSITGVFVGNSIAKMGDRQGNMRGAPAGGVAWPVDPTTHDGASFIYADAFFAHYDAKKKEVYCLDDIGGKRHTGADPLRVGKNVEIHAGEKRSGRGIVVRSAEYGTAGLYKNIFIHADADLIAHHRQPDPPDNSSLVHDPGEGPDDWAGGLHYPLRVRKWIEQFCQSKSAVDADPLFAPLLNFTRNGDGTVAHGAAHFATAEATLSHEGGGFATPADDGQHLLGNTGDAPVHQGGLEIAKTLFGSTPNGIIYSPAEFISEPWKSGPRGPFERRVEWREDEADRHPRVCPPGSTAKGRKKWMTWTDFKEYDPGSGKTPDEDDPGAEKGDPGSPSPPDNTTEAFNIGQGFPDNDPGEDVKVPAPSVKAPPVRDKDPGGDVKEPGSPTTGDPSTATPNQVESPSRYAHPRPGIPDGDTGGADGPVTGSESQSYWRKRYGFDEEEWNRTPIVGHEDSMPVYESSTANDNGDGPAGRWPTRKTTHELLILDADGRVIGRDPAHGPGSVIDMPANMNASHALQANDGNWPDTIPAFARIVFAAKNASTGATVDGRFGLGSRIHTSAYPVRGFDISLDFSSDPDNPDILFQSRDETGAQGTGDFHFNGGTLHSNGGPVLTGLTAIVDGDDANTTEADTDHMSVTVQGGEWYQFEAWLPITAVADVPYINFDGGTTTINAIRYTISQITTTGTAGETVINDEVTSKATDITVARGTAFVKGFIQVDPAGAGTFVMRHADCTVGNGAWMRLTRVR